MKHNWGKLGDADTRVHGRLRAGSSCRTLITQGQENKHVLPGGSRKLLVPRGKEPEALLIYNESHRAQTAHNVSSKKHQATVERAARLAISPQSPSQATVKEMNRQPMCTSYFVNKTIKLRKKRQRECFYLAQHRIVSESVATGSSPAREQWSENCTARKSSHTGSRGTEYLMCPSFTK